MQIILTAFGKALPIDFGIISPKKKTKTVAEIVETTTVTSSNDTGFIIPVSKKVHSDVINTEKKILTILFPINPVMIKLSNLSKHLRTSLALFLPSSSKTRSLITLA